jgi:HD-GYP domain-containing protein (c-di-GMP phosphodiesterase class II)
LAGEDIPFWARIFTVVDVWDAMCSDRPYRKALPEKQALQYIREESGRIFDPRVAEAFLELRAQEPDLMQ